MTRPPASELLKNPAAFLDRQHLYELGLQQRSVEYVFRTLPVVSFPGVRRVYVKVADYLRLVDESTYGDGEVRPA